jgi:hypothetical protein
MKPHGHKEGNRREKKGSDLRGFLKWEGRALPHGIRELWNRGGEWKLTALFAIMDGDFILVGSVFD